MKTLLVAIVVGAMLGLSPVPAQAATVVKTVNGFDYPTGLGFVSESCTGGATTGATALYRRGGLRGTHSTGVSFGGATGKEGGVQAKVATPRTLTSISMATYHPQGPDADTLADGHFVALYDPSGNNFQNGYYFAKLGLDATSTGWGTWSNLAAASLTWSYYDGVNVLDNQFSGTVKALADNRGTNGSGAWVGFEFGCNGRDYFMDDLEIATSSGTRIYDFEGVLARSFLSTPPSHSSMKVKRDVTRVNLVQKQRHWILGDAAGYSDGVLDAVWTSGNAGLYAKPYGASAYRRVATGTYSDTTWAQFLIAARKQVRYQIRTSASDTYESAVSKTLVVSVHRRINARVADTKVRRGQTIKVTGKLFPGDRGVRVTLQRKIGAKWRGIASGRSRAAGKYAVNARAATVGRWKLRVSVGNAKGNLGNTSPSTTVTITRPPPSPTPDPVVPVVVENPVPETHIPGGEIKARALVRQLLRQVRFPVQETAPVPPHSDASTTGPVMTQRGVSQS